MLEPGRITARPRMADRTSGEKRDDCQSSRQVISPNAGTLWGFHITCKRFRQNQLHLLKAQHFCEPAVTTARPPLSSGAFQVRCGPRTQMSTAPFPLKYIHLELFWNRSCLISGLQRTDMNI